MYDNKESSRTGRVFEYDSRIIYSHVDSLVCSRVLLYVFIYVNQWSIKKERNDEPFLLMFNDMITASTEGVHDMGELKEEITKWCEKYGIKKEKIMTRKEVNNDGKISKHERNSGTVSSTSGDNKQVLQAG